MLLQTVQKCIGFTLFLAACLLFVVSCNHSSINSTSNETPTIDSLALGIADSLYDLGMQELHKRIEYDKGAAILRQADSIYQRIERYDKAILAKTNIAYYAKGLEISEDSIRRPLLDAMSLSSKLDSNSYRLGVLYIHLGMSYRRSEDFELASFYAKKALEILKKHVTVETPKIALELNDSYANIAYAESALFNHQKAIEYGEKGLQDGYKNKVHPLYLKIVLLEVYSRAGEYGKADELLKTIEENNEIEDQPIFVRSDYFLKSTDYLTFMGRYDTAQKRLDQFETILKKSGLEEHFTKEYLESRRIQIYLDTGQYEKVIQLIGGIDLVNSEGNVINKDISADLYILAQAHWLQENREMAISAIERSIGFHLNSTQGKDFLAPMEIDDAIFKVSLFPKLRFKTEMLVQLYEENRDEKHLNAALEGLIKVHELIKDLGQRSDEDAFLTDHEFKSIYESLFQLYREKWKTQPNESIFYKALTLSDESKNVMVLQELRSLRQERLFKNIPAEIKLKERGFQKALDSTNFSGLNNGNRASKQKRDSLNSAFSAFKSSLKDQFPNYYGLVYGNEIPIKELLESNHNDFAIIQFFVGEESIYVLHKNESNLIFDRIPLLEDLKKAIEITQKGVRNPNSNSHVSASKLIYDTLFKKYMGKKGQKTVVVLDDILHFLPLEALSNENDNLLIEDFKLQRMNSIREVSAANDPMSEIIIFAPFANTGQGRLPQLSYSLEEANYIKKIVPGKLKVDQDANKTAFLQEASNYSVVHLATHTEVNREAPQFSTIYFSENTENPTLDQNLKIEELYGIKLNSNLVVLSSCETGVGKEVKGRGVQSISNAFAYAGIPSTLMSLWKVPDKETSQIMISFYDHLSQGMSKDDALRSAKLDYLKATSDENLRHPFYWAGFVLSGDTAPIQMKNASTFDFWILGLLIVVGGLIVWYFFYRRPAVSNDNQA